MPDRKIHVVGDDPRLEALAQEQVDDPNNNAQYVAIQPANEEAESTEVSGEELKDLGEFLEAIRNVLLGHEQRLANIETFLTVQFPGDETTDEASEDTPEA